MDSLMNLVLEGLEGVAKLQDDVAVHGRTQEEHDRRLHAVLDRMTEYGLTLNLKKCEFQSVRSNFWDMSLEIQAYVQTPEKSKT